jgi:hypothetical protein
MERRGLVYLMIILLVIAGIFFLLKLFSSEDDWMCRDGVWIKHGNPSASIPLEKNCGGYDLKKIRDSAKLEAMKLNSTLTGNYEYNENSKTIWFEIEQANKIKPGCNPAVVFELVTKEFEINWRCTGLLTE